MGFAGGFLVVLVIFLVFQIEGELPPIEFGIFFLLGGIVGYILDQFIDLDVK